MKPSYVVTYSNNSVIVNDIDDFCPEHVFDCGQAFRWDYDGKGYIGVVKDKIARVKFNKDKRQLILENCNEEDYIDLWEHYLDLDRDYASIKADLSKDIVLGEAMKYGWGIRILNQDPWETLISFIISANNNVKRIKKIIKKLSERFGNEFVLEDKSYYTFPSPEALAKADEDDFKKSGCGYRGPYIKKTAQMIYSNELDLDSLKGLSYEEAYKEIIKCMGVGPKVADCVLLFSLEKTEAFPVDVWIKRIMEYLYIGYPMSNKEIKSYSFNKFGKYAGLAQQYLFYYARELKIGI